MKFGLRTLVMAPAFASLLPSAQADEGKAMDKDMGVVTIIGTRPTSLPTQIPTTMEGITQQEIAAKINATDSEDALKYFPSLLVRKRYIGDYNHAVLSSRASGTGNSARSAVYADGILLSNYLGNGAAYTPRWALVTPEEIERVDVMYGPFSAAYPGNSVGAVVDYVTRMPERLEAHVKAAYFTQPSFDLYDTHDSYNGHQESASLGDRAGSFSWWINFNHTWSHGQPLTFPVKTLASASGSGGTPVSGALPGLNPSNAPQYILGTATEYTTVQDHAKLKLAYDFTPDLRASYVFGYWRNEAEGRPNTYLRDAAGNPLFVDTVNGINIDGLHFTQAATDFNLTNDDLIHLMHGLSIKSNTGGVWDWEAAASLYDYDQDESRTPTVALPGAFAGGAGTLIDQDGTGWKTFALKGTWRPAFARGAHGFDFGYQQDRYTLRILRSNVDDWIRGAPLSSNTDVGGKTRTQAIYAQDVWRLSDKWKTVLGLRLEQWQASDGFTRTAGSAPPAYPSRKQSYASPKAALAFQATDDTLLKVSLGRAVRMPTVNELYGATTGGALEVINDPYLRPEKSWTSELSLEQALGDSLLRVTGFFETTKDALYSERTAVNSLIVSRIVNVGKIQTPGVEISWVGDNLLTEGLDFSASVTWADSRIKENDGYVVVPGDTIDKYQPRVPVWRATALASYRFSEQWNATLGARYSGKQYSTLNNGDPNGFAYTGASRFFTVDARVRYRFARQWSAALGIDNLNNYKYWNFHPYPQRSFLAELQFDL